MKFGIKLMAAIAAQLAVVSVAGAQTSEDVIVSAKEEGLLVIYGTNSTAQIQPHIDGFRADYPGIEVEYTEVNSSVLYTRITSEMAAGSQTADVVMSGSSELMLASAKDGNFLAYDSAALGKTPNFNAYERMVFELEAEPMCNLYNREALDETDLPKTRAEFAEALSNPESGYSGKVTMYDIELSGVGYSALYRDSKENPDFWSFAEALGEANATFLGGGFAMAERVGSGEMWIAYNIPCQVLVAVEENPNIGFFFFEDYILMSAQYAAITQTAAHPNAAKAFVDWLMSEQGQALYGQISGMYPLIANIEDLDVTGLRASGMPMEGPALDDEMLEVLDPEIRPAFIKDWKEALARGRSQQ